MRLAVQGIEDVLGRSMPNLWLPFYGFLIEAAMSTRFWRDWKTNWRRSKVNNVSVGRWAASGFRVYLSLLPSSWPHDQLQLWLCPVMTIFLGPCPLWFASMTMTTNWQHK